MSTYTIGRRTVVEYKDGGVTISTYDRDRKDVVIGETPILVHELRTPVTTVELRSTLEEHYKLTRGVLHYLRFGPIRATEKTYDADFRKWLGLRFRPQRRTKYAKT